MTRSLFIVASDTHPRDAAALVPQWHLDPVATEMDPNGHGNKARRAARKKPAHAKASGGALTCR
jgi:hypothetical protein